MVGLLGRNFVEYYFELFINCRFETFCIRLNGIGEPRNFFLKKSDECIGVKKIAKIEKIHIFRKLSVFCPTCSNIISDCFQSADMKLPVFVHMV